MAITATVSSKGQITLPIAIRKQLGIELGSQISFEVNANNQLIIKPEKPISAYYGILKPYLPADFDTEIPKEKDRF
jgi:AbrB family looped-hinge helix DNA binding protein